MSDTYLESILKIGSSNIFIYLTFCFLNLKLIERSYTLIFIRKCGLYVFLIKEPSRLPKLVVK